MKAKYKEINRRADWFCSDAGYEARAYKCRYEKKQFNYETDCWGSKSISNVTMSSIYEAYEEYRSNEW